METIDYQKQLFERIRHVREGEDHLLEIQQLLGLGRSSVYRRIQGKTLLTLEEWYKLVNHFGLEGSPPARTQMSTHISFSYDQRQEAGVGGLLELYTEIFQRFVEEENGLFTYVSRELPLFYFFTDPLLMTFKFLVWETIHASGDLGEELSLNRLRITDSMIENLMRIQQLYYSIPSQEIWSVSGIAITLEQLRYLVRLHDQLSAQEALTICTHLHQMLEQLEVATAHSQKITEPKGGASCKIYVNEIAHADNSLVFQSDNTRLILLNTNNLNFVSTDDPGFFHHKQEYVQNLRKHSMSISEEGMRNRKEVFRQLHDQVAIVEQELG